jgi:hypothetical protein
MSEPEPSVIPCPRCNIPMLTGHLKEAVNVVHIESVHSLRHCSLRAWICPACGHVELQAIHPQDLARNDLSDEDLGFRRKDWSERL